MLRNVSGGRVSAGGPNGGAQLAEALHGALDFPVVRPAAIEADEVLEALGIGKHGAGGDEDAFGQRGVEYKSEPGPFNLSGTTRDGSQYLWVFSHSVKLICERL